MEFLHFCQADTFPLEYKFSRNVRKRTFGYMHPTETNQPVHLRSLIRFFVVRMHLRSLIRFFVVRMKTLRILGYLSEFFHIKKSDVFIFLPKT